MTNQCVCWSNSGYTSPMVCIRTTDGSLCLYLDHHKLNNKPLPYREPIPKVQDILDSPGGRSGPQCST